MTKVTPALSLEIEEALEDILEDMDSPIPIASRLDDSHVSIEGVSYELVTNYRDAYSLDALNQRYSDFFARYDYIVGDWGHEKLRLKGFYYSSNPLATPDNDIAFLMEYINEYCNFGCQYFVLERDPQAERVFVQEEEPKRIKKNNRQNKRNRRKGSEKELASGKTRPNSAKATKAKGPSLVQVPKTPSKPGRKLELDGKIHIDLGPSTKKAGPNKNQKSFSIKEVGETKESKKLQTKQQRPNRGFSIREKPAERGN